LRSYGNNTSRAQRCEISSLLQIEACAVTDPIPCWNRELTSVAASQEDSGRAANSDLIGAIDGAL